MATTIKVFKDGTSVIYDMGKFDKGCVYLVEKDGTRRPPKDRDYFLQMQRLSKEYTSKKVYGDFVKVYDATEKSINVSTLNLISQIAEEYGKYANDVDKMFTVLYAAMIAEEKKEYTKLGKRIKRLGVHQLLMESEPLNVAADSTRGKDWRTIADMCKERGF